MLSGLLILMVVLSQCCFGLDFNKTAASAPCVSPWDLQTQKPLLRTTVTSCLNQSLSSGTNLVWCSSFQLAWNELCDLNEGPIEMRDPPGALSFLNRRVSNKNDLAPEDCLAMAGWGNDGFFQKLTSELKSKFSKSFEALIPSLGPKIGWVAIAHIEKELPFQCPFSRFKENLVFGGYYVDSFGIKQFLRSKDKESRMAKQVVIRSYRDSDDFVIELVTKSKDDVLVLAKIPPKSTIYSTFLAVEERIKNVEPSAMRDFEELNIPIIRFNIFQSYAELCRSPIKSSKKEFDETRIAAANQSIRFRLDENGAGLKSSALIFGSIAPRAFFFDRPFLLYLKRRKSQVPYFVLWLENAELLDHRGQKFRFRTDDHLK